MVAITKRFRFEACHHLPEYEGQCHNLHGHSYKLDVTVTGDIQEESSKSGMIIDFKDLKKAIKNVCGKLDHSNLNDYFVNPTAEIMVICIAEHLHKELGDKVKLLSLKLWETEDSYAEWRAE